MYVCHSCALCKHDKILYTILPALQAFSYLIVERSLSALANYGVHFIICGILRDGRYDTLYTEILFVMEFWTFFFFRQNIQSWIFPKLHLLQARLRMIARVSTLRGLTRMTQAIILLFGL